MNTTSSSILTATPYKFTPSEVGLTYIGSLLDSLVSAIYSGILGDWFALKMARQNGGVLEPEHRLWLFSLACIAMPFSLILRGVGAAHQVHWFGIAFAIFMKGLQSSLVISLSIKYTLNCYRDIGIEAIVTVIFIRNTMSFAMNYAITPWVANICLQNIFIIAASASLVAFLTFLPMTIYGKVCRRWTAERYRKYVEQEKRLGLVH